MVGLTVLSLEVLVLRAVFELGADSERGCGVEEGSEGRPDYHCDCGQARVVASKEWDAVQLQRECSRDQLVANAVKERKDKDRTSTSTRSQRHSRVNGMVSK